jgi:acyl-CoA synthetase (NDP forming)
VRRVGVVADGGGHAGVASDVVEAAGLSVPEFTADISSALRALLPPSAGVSNPVDLAGAGEQDITSFASVLGTILASPAIDSVLLTGYFGGYGSYGENLARAEIDTARAMAETARTHGKPVVVHTMHPDSAAARVLADSGVPVFRAVEDAAGALGVIAETTGPQHHAGAEGAPVEAVTSDAYWDSRELFRRAGVEFPQAQLVQTCAEAVAAADTVGYPVVLKAMGLLHKSDSGGVALGLGTAQQLTDAFTRMDNSLAAPAYCVEAMADLNEGVELIVGVQTDPRFGPVAMVGLGGIFTEVLADVTFALAPVDTETARGLLDNLRASALLRGVRGRPPINLDAAADAIAAVTAVAAAHPEIAELEINPLLVTPKHAVGLDARIVLSSSNTH